MIYNMQMSLENYVIPFTNYLVLGDLLEQTIKVLEKHKIKYWVDGGSLLGAIRNKGQIPWDDDVDIGIDIKDQQKLADALKDFFDLGYSVAPVGSMLKVYLGSTAGWSKTEFNAYGTPTLDIFFWTKDGDKYVLHDVRQRQQWPNCYHYKHDLFPLKKYEFDEFTVKGPNNAIPYLDRMYTNWRTTAVIDIREYDDNYKTTKVSTVTIPLGEKSFQN
jgi:lipopolysaccharide cholinephosphotransferase